MKKVLFITYDFPYPTNSGGKNRAYNLIKHGKKNIEIHLISFVREKIADENIEHIKKIGVEKIVFVKRKKLSAKNILLLILARPHHSIVYNLYFDRSILEIINNYIIEHKIDIVHAESLYTGIYLPHLKGSVKKIFGSENIEHIVYRDFIKSKVPTLLSPLSELQLFLLKREEIAVFKKSDQVIVVSNNDGKIARNYNSNCDVILNGVDVESFSKVVVTKKEKSILFVGNFTYFPNVDAVDFIYKNVFKKLRGVKFRIIGKGATGFNFAKESNVEASEYVEDIISEYKRAGVFIFPVRFGGGTNFKVLEAMAAGTPVVAYPKLVQNIDFLTPDSYFPAKNENDFVQYIEKIVNQEDVSSVTRKASSIINDKYNWKKIGETVNVIWNKI